MPKFNPHSPDCSVGMTEIDAMRWVQKQVGMTLTVMHEGNVVLFVQGELFVKGKGVLGAVVEAQKILHKMKKPQEVPCS